MVSILFTCMTSWTGSTCIITQFFVFFFWQEGTSAKNIVQREEKAFPFLIFTGTLDLLGKIYIAADQQILCYFEASMVEAALALLATYYVFMFNYPPGLTNFYLFLKKCILHIQDGKKLPSSLISFVNSIHELQGNV